MGRVTANGWRVLDRDECATIDVPGGQLAVHPVAAPIFADLAARFDAEVEPLIWPGCWGYALRPIKGTGTYSNHSSGTAIDLNAPRHPQGVPAARNYTRGQRGALGAILADYAGVITWGGTWDLPDTDGMHFEITPGVTVGEVEAVAARLTGPPPAPAPPPAGFTGPDLRGYGPALRGEHGNNGDRVAGLQWFLSVNYPGYGRTLGPLTPDGWWGDVTTAWLAEFAHRSHIPSADGRNIGPQLAAALYRAGLGRNLSAARQRAASHVTRTARR
jgi:D-alanyl-D-alanine carboxypeptidase